LFLSLVLLRITRSIAPHSIRVVFGYFLGVLLLLPILSEIFFFPVRSALGSSFLLQPFKFLSPPHGREFLLESQLCAAPKIEVGLFALVRPSRRSLPPFLP